MHFTINSNELFSQYHFYVYNHIVIPVRILRDNRFIILINNFYPIEIEPVNI